MKQNQFYLIESLLKKDFFLITKKKSFFLIDYDFSLKTIKQLLKLKNIFLPIFLITNNKQHSYLLNKYILKFNLKNRVFVSSNDKIPSREAVLILLDNNIYVKDILKENKLNFMLSTIQYKTKIIYYNICIEIENNINLVILLLLIKTFYKINKN
jgi:hypothetical protein